MTGEPIPDSDHLSRYVKGSQIDDDGSVDGAAFRLRVIHGIPETSLSVNWLEHLHPVDRRAQIDALRAVFSRKMSVSGTARFAVLNVGELVAHVQEGPEHRQLRVVHDPVLVEPVDPSHSGILGLRFDDDLIADLIAEVVRELYPAKGS